MRFFKVMWPIVPGSNNEGMGLLLADEGFARVSRVSSVTQLTPSTGAFVDATGYHRFMRRTSFADSECPIARTVDLIGDWWTPLVLREAFYGLRRFDDMQRALGIGRNVLTERLRRLVEEGLLARSKYQDHPERFEYHLTEKGQDLLPVLAAMIQWGDTWLRSRGDRSIVLRHRTCGRRMHVTAVCDQCREPLAARDVEVERPQSRRITPPPASRTGAARAPSPPAARTRRRDRRA
jgi:DNA-binding HxlR family transcriptional regulator